MGNSVCCASACGNSVRPPEPGSRITIWGDYFNQDTRALLIVCEMADA